MNIEIRYLSKSGNTKKIADAIASEIGVQAKDINEPISDKVDLLFIGCTTYAFSLDSEMKKYLLELNNEIENIVLFSTSAGFKSALKQMKKILSKKYNVINEFFYCKGEYQKVNLGKPDNDDLENAKKFARNIIDKVK